MAFSFLGQSKPHPTTAPRKQLQWAYQYTDDFPTVHEINCKFLSSLAIFANYHNFCDFQNIWSGLTQIWNFENCCKTNGNAFPFSKSTTFSKTFFEDRHIFVLIKKCIIFNILKFTVLSVLKSGTPGQAIEKIIDVLKKC